MSELKGQEVFAAGIWNGTQFSEADLDAMVQSFEALGLAGRVPLKFGHDSPKPDGQPSLGWVSRVWRVRSDARVAGRDTRTAPGLRHSDMELLVAEAPGSHRDELLPPQAGQRFLYG